MRLISVLLPIPIFFPFFSRSLSSFSFPFLLLVVANPYKMVFARAVVGLALIWCAGLQGVLAQCGPNYPCINEETLDFETSDCQSYHIFVVRGSDSSYPGHLGELIRLTCKGLNESCGYENVIYPANSSFSGPEMWCNSAATGASNGQAQIREYAEKCPDAKLMVFGFSQGGSVALDIVGGGGGPAFECVQADNGPLDRSEVPGSNSKSSNIPPQLRF
jgi:hypothetical protein